MLSPSVGLGELNISGVADRKWGFLRGGLVNRLSRSIGAFPIMHPDSLLEILLVPHKRIGHNVILAP